MELEKFSRSNGVDLSFEDLIKIQANRPPFLFIDSAHNVVENIQAGSKFLFKEDWDLFSVHFEHEPLVPASIMIEMMMQTTALAPLISMKNKPSNQKLVIPLVFLTSVKKALFKSKITPNSKVEVLSLITWFKGNFGTANAAIYNSKKIRVAYAEFQFYCDF
jgi:3-hydroxymyristoyl/3-hydroxydecanoyl-(acyl carrier protein) dehydratase